VGPYRIRYIPASRYSRTVILKWKSPTAVKIKDPSFVQYYVAEEYTGFVKVKKKEYS
jgi:hypothetical protein